MKNTMWILILTAMFCSVASAQDSHISADATVILSHGLGTPKPGVGGGASGSVKHGRFVAAFSFNIASLEKLEGGSNPGSSVEVDARGRWYFARAFAVDGGLRINANTTRLYSKAGRTPLIGVTANYHDIAFIGADALFDDGSENHAKGVGIRGEFYKPVSERLALKVAVYCRVIRFDSPHVDSLSRVGESLRVSVGLARVWKGR